MCFLPAVYLEGNLIYSNHCGGNADNGDLLQKIPCVYCYTQCCQPCKRLPPTHTSAGDFRTLTDKSGLASVGSLLLPPGPWCIRLCLCPLIVDFPALCNFWQLYGGVSGDLLQEGLCHTQVCCIQSPCPCDSTLLARTSTGDTQTQFCLSLCGVSVSWYTQGLFELY